MAAEIIRLDDPDILVRLRRHAGARRLTLSVRDGEARLTAPPGAPDAEARRFLARQREWLREAMRRSPPPQSVRLGARLPFGDGVLEIADGGRSRGCRRVGATLLAPAVGTGPAVAAWLKQQARAALVPTAERAADRLGRRIGGVSLRDTRSRWGSCTARGDLSFSWRLAMAPEAVQTYVAIHEAAHLVEMNHGPAFWALVAELCPDYRARRAWLRAKGRSLHGYDFRGAPRASL